MASLIVHNISNQAMSGPACLAARETHVRMVIDMATSVNMYTTISSRHVGTNTCGSIPTYDRSATAASAAESATCHVEGYASFCSNTIAGLFFKTLSKSRPRDSSLTSLVIQHKSCSRQIRAVPHRK
jgi:hypothetical protein